VGNNAQRAIRASKLTNEATQAATQVVDDATQQNAELVGEAAAAAQRMSDEARKPTRSVEIFKLESGASPQVEAARPRSRSAA
jgi:methyl-accepting chemotaxis protein